MKNFTLLILCISLLSQSEANSKSFSKQGGFAKNRTAVPTKKGYVDLAKAAKCSKLLKIFENELESKNKEMSQLVQKGQSIIADKSKTKEVEAIQKNLMELYQSTQKLAQEIDSLRKNIIEKFKSVMDSKGEYGKIRFLPDFHVHSSKKYLDSKNYVDLTSAFIKFQEDELRRSGLILE